MVYYTVEKGQGLKKDEQLYKNYITQQPAEEQVHTICQPGRQQPLRDADDKIFR